MDSGSFLCHQVALAQRLQGDSPYSLSPKKCSCLESKALLRPLQVWITGNHPPALDLETTEAISQPTGPLLHLAIQVRGEASHNWAQVLPVRKDL